MLFCGDCIPFISYTIHNINLCIRSVSVCVRCSCVCQCGVRVRTPYVCLYVIVGIGIGIGDCWSLTERALFSNNRSRITSGVLYSSFSDIFDCVFVCVWEFTSITMPASYTHIAHIHTYYIHLMSRVCML